MKTINNVNAGNIPLYSRIDMKGSEKNTYIIFNSQNSN